MGLLIDKIINNAGDKGVDWVINIIIQIIDFFSGCIFYAAELVLNLLFTFIEEGMDIGNSLPNINALFSFFTNVASSLLIIMFLKIVLCNYVLDLDGESDVDPLQSLVNIAFSLAMINNGETLYKYLMKMARLLRNGLVDAIEFSTIPDDFKNISELAKNIVEFISGLEALGSLPVANFVLGGIPSLIITIWLIVVFVMIIVLIIKMMFRTVELFIYRLLFPLFCVDLITPSKELFKPFIASYLTTIFGYLIQYLCLLLSLNLIVEITSISTSASKVFLNPIISTFLLYFAIKSPKWLQKFVYSSGAGQVAGNAGRSLGGMVSNAMMMIGRR